MIPPAAQKPAPVEFALDARHWSDKPKSVAVGGDFNAWSVATTPLSDPDHNGIWTANVPLPPGVHHYKFVIDGTRWINDDAADRALESDDGMGGKNSGVRVAAP